MQKNFVDIKHLEIDDVYGDNFYYDDYLDEDDNVKPDPDMEQLTLFFIGTQNVDVVDCSSKWIIKPSDKNKEGLFLNLNSKLGIKRDFYNNKIVQVYEFLYTTSTTYFSYYYYDGKYIACDSNGCLLFGTWMIKNIDEKPVLIIKCQGYSDFQGRDISARSRMKKTTEGRIFTENFVKEDNGDFMLDSYRITIPQI